MSIVRLKQKGQLTIPATIRTALRLTEGDMLEARVAKGSIVLSPKTLVDRRIDAAITKGLNDARAGRTTPPFATVDDFRAHRRSGQYKRLLKDK